MERIKIGNTDVFLEDYGQGKGKIIISNTYGYNFSYFWGSMGSNLREFLLRINESYFIGKLCSNSNGDFSGRKTVKAIRKAMREHNSCWEIPWYKYMDAQKELRELLKDLEQCNEINSFYYECKSIIDNYWGLHFSYDEKHEKEEFESNVEALFSEPHYYFEYEDSNELIFLKRLFKDLQKELKVSNLKQIA